tara:strand:- start:367 stop:1623 length:1257 start_codon:yes stop_codon:yes gene_type:complete
MEFQKKSVAEFNAMTAESQAIYLDAKSVNESEMSLKMIGDLASTQEKNAALEVEIKSIKDASLTLGKKVSELEEKKGKAIETKSNFQEVFESKSVEIKSFLDGKGSSVSLEFKADANYSDLTQTGVLDQLAPGISDIVTKSTKVADLFTTIPMIGETYRYLEQTSAVRDAQGVALCAKNFTSLTKEDIGEVAVNYVKLKDIVNICKDYADDYGFVENRYRTLLTQSISFLRDTDLLLGTNSTTSTQSIDKVSSEFSATNVSAPIVGSIQHANYSDLILGMATQIDILGKLGSFVANAALVNKMDFFKLVESAKDATGQYLDPRLTKVGNNWFIGGLLIIPLVDVAENTLYVMDTTKGNILDRQSIVLTMSDSNGTNFVDEYVTMMVTAKLQFLVENNNANAFMKCSDVGLAIEAINEA